MKKVSLSVVLFLSLLIGLVGMSPIHSNAQSPVSELLVEYAEDVRMTFSEEVDEQVEKRKKISNDIELWSLTEGANAEELQQKLEDDTNILHVELDVERKLTAEAIDPNYYEQWWIPHVHPLDIWSRVPEQKIQVSVGVIDSGVDIMHEDLDKRIRADGYNFYEDNNNVYDQTGHGTKVAGVIAAEYGNDLGVTGIVGPYDVKILPLKVFGSSNTTKVSFIVAAVDYAISRDIDVLNLSFGGPIKSEIENNAIQRAIAEGITVVAAAGNERKQDNQQFYPASYDNVISVGAVDRWNEYMYFEKYNEDISLVAPGIEIYSTLPGNQYEISRGTSFTSPIVAGAVAMVKSLYPDKTPQEIKKLLQDTATYFEPPGIEIYFGPGLLNLQALSDILPSKTIPVERIELDQEAVTLNLSSTVEQNQVALFEKVYPVNAADKSVTWKSSDSAIAEVNESGVVTVKGIGTAFVKVKTRSGEFTAIATINVIKDGEGTEFRSDFEDMQVSPNKVFQVSFNRSLSFSKDFSQDIVISRKADGSGRIYDFIARASEFNSRAMHILPKNEWEEGTYYLTVTQNILSYNSDSLKKESRMKFEVSEK